MALRLNMVGTPLQWSLLRKGTRVFGLLGKATPFGLTSFSRHDIPGSWALTSEFGCLRLERLTGEERVTGDRLVLPTAFSYDYGVIGASGSPETARQVFGLLPSELEQLVTVLRRGSFPILGFSQAEQKCSISANLIPALWPHVVISNMAVCGNVVSVETFVRLLVSSLPQGQLAVRFPGLQPVIKQMFKLMLVQRSGVPYCREMLELAPMVAMAAK